MKRSIWLASTALACLASLATSAQAKHQGVTDAFGPDSPFKHIVVIYQENHSFDNLYGNWGLVNGEPVEGRSAAPPDHTTQVRQDNATAYQCLLQNDVNLTSPAPLTTTCTDSTGATSFDSHFPNGPFDIDTYIAAGDTTCPPPGVFAAHGIPKGAGDPGGCTEDIVHRYYSEQYQIHNGHQDRYVTGSDAAGLSMGYYDSTKLPIYAYLHGAGAPNYVIADHFFQGAFGGSFLNHHWLIAAAAPVFANAPNDGSANDLHSVVDANGMATSTPLYASPLGAGALDRQLTASCAPPASHAATPDGVTCGDFAVNTTQPAYQPYSPGTADPRRLPPLDNLTIGDEMSHAGVSWAWYSGGWSNANGDVRGAGWTNGNTAAEGCTDPNALATAVWPNCADKLFQFHHQPFNYYRSFAPGTVQRAQRLRDEQEFIKRAHDGRLLDVSFIKPIGADNEHPGYGSESEGSSHLVDLIRAVEDGPDGDKTLIIITYDEFGGQWDHVPPPGTHGSKGAHDRWGPGTRLPALLISKRFRYSGVDHVSHDTTSIIATLEHRFNLGALGTRDAHVIDLTSAANRGLRNTNSVNP